MTPKASPDPTSGDDVGAEKDGAELMSLFMGEVNQREKLRRAEGLRLLKQPSALLPPHAVLEHVLGSLRNPDAPTEGKGLHQAFLFSALEQEHTPGPVDYRRDWTDPEEAEPRFLDKESFDRVTRTSLWFLLGMSEFSIAGPPVFSEDDHQVTIPVHVVPDARTSTLTWVALDFRLSRARAGSHRDCWLVEQATVTAREGPPDTPLRLV